jgi:hypothetical protein
VPSIEFTVIMAMLGLCTAISIYAQYKVTQIAASNLASRVSDLDEALGEAISQLVEGGMVPGSQQNPLLSIFAEALRGKIDAPSIVEASIRTDDGKFKKLEE